MKALATAGHTDHHLSYLVSLAEGDGSSAPVVCTGGSMLLGSTGRTDLLGVEKAEPLAHAQWRSVRRLLTTLPPDTRIYPTHGFGSFCSSTPSAGDVLAASTIAEEGQKNPAALMDEDVFVVAVLANLPPVPAYYRYMAPLNRRGPLAPRLEPVALLDGARLAEAVKDSEWVVDLRHRRRYAAEHLRGTLNLELGGNLATYLGWLVPFESRFILVAEHEAEVTEARRLVASIGREEVFAAALWPDALPGLRDHGSLGRYRAARFSDLAAAWDRREESELHVLDVRHPHEWRQGHVLGAQHLPLPELVARRGEVPSTGQLWVHCGAGFRSAAAASLMSGWGLSPVVIDDTWQHAAETGLPTTAS